MAAKSRICGKSIASFIAAPSKVAQNLEWRKRSGTLLNITVCRDHVDLLISSHPELGTPAQTLSRLSIEKRTTSNRKVVDAGTAKDLVEINEAYSVCGWIVNWPVQKEGWCGNSCGRVLHFLDGIATADVKALHRSRPICLYDRNHILSQIDQWGRHPVYGRIVSNKSVHFASLEQYRDPTTEPLALWNDFCLMHWPSLVRNAEHSVPTAYDDFVRDEGPSRRLSFA